MNTKEIIVKGLRNLSEQIIREENDDKMGINLRALLDGELAMAIRNIDLSNYKERNSFIDKIESRLMESDWISLSDGTTFQLSFTPTKKYS